jgi:hypothetical protein
MDLIDRLRELSARIPKLKEGSLIKTEEGTKNALVMPFINALGYNVFDPTEVTPELVADVGTKKGEKVDYAILRDGNPIMLFECKCCGVDLSKEHASQLYRYFSATSARFGVLTDGIIYRFYTDLEEPNKMDTNPFFIFDMTEVKEAAVEELKKFTKSSFDEQQIITTASELKYKSAIRNHLAALLAMPSDNLVRLLAHDSRAFNGRFTQNVIDDFRPIVRDSLRAFINEQVENRLKTALASENQEQVGSVEPPAPQEPEANGNNPLVVTTPEEKEAFLVIRAILRASLDVKRITMRDAQSYCAILLDDNNRRPLARLYFGKTKKQIGIFDEQRKEQFFLLESIDDIYKYAENLQAAVRRYETVTS